MWLAAAIAALSILCRAGAAASKVEISSAWFTPAQSILSDSPNVWSFHDSRLAMQRSMSAAKHGEKLTLREFDQARWPLWSLQLLFCSSWWAWAILALHGLCREANKRKKRAWRDLGNQLHGSTDEVGFPIRRSPYLCRVGRVHWSCHLMQQISKLAPHLYMKRSMNITHRITRTVCQIITCLVLVWSAYAVN